MKRKLREARVGKKFECASDWLVLLLVMVAAVVLVGLLAGRNVWREIILYWAVLLVKNLCAWFATVLEE